MQHLDVIKEWALNNHRGIMAALAAIAVILVIIGLCFSWFVGSERKIFKISRNSG